MPLAEAHEKFILKQLARGGETMAHGGLLHLEPGSGTRHAALFHQGGKGDEQVRFEESEIEMVDGGHAPDRLDRLSISPLT